MTEYVSPQLPSGVQLGTTPSPSGNSATTEPYDMAVYIPGTFFSSSATLAQFILDRTVFFVQNFAPSVAYCANAPTANTSIRVLQNGTVIGTISFLAGANRGTYSSSYSSTTLNNGDILAFMANTTSDTTFGNVSITFSGLRSA